MGTAQLEGRPAGWGCHLSAVVGACLVVVRVLTPASGAGRVAYLVVTGGASLVAALGARRAGGNRVAVLIAVGLGLSFLGDVAYEAQFSLDGVAPDASIADVGWIGSYLVIGAALLQLLRGTERRIDVDGAIDIAAVFILGLLLQWQLILQGLLDDTSVGLGVRLLWAAYPVGDAALLALVVRVALARHVRGWTSALLAAGAACWLVSDTAYTWLATEGPLAGWLDAGWLIGAGLLAAAAWLLPTGSAPVAEPRTEEVGIARIAVALVPLPIPALLEIGSDAAGRDGNPVVIGGATVALLAVAAVRAVRLVQVLVGARARIEAQERQARALADNSSDAVAVVDADGRVRNDDPALATLVGLAGGSLRGRSLAAFVHPADLPTAQEAFDRCLAEPGQRRQVELRVQRPDDRPTWVSARVVNLLDDPAVGGILVTLHDVTSRKRAEDELVHQAFHDSLTGLANRALFGNRVEHAVDRTTRTGRHPAVIFIDLDGFKEVNDTMGHAAGDRLLQEIARRLGASVREGDTVARLGGDEFAILVEESLRPLQDAAAVADRALAAVRAPIEIDGQVVPVTASAGLATGDDGATAATLLRDADAAMYAAKASGKDRWVQYDPAMRAAAVERQELERDLSAALERGELRLVYQPVVVLEAGRVTGFEALLRWDHPEHGTLLPERFLPLAEDSGLIVPIGRWVLREACEAAAGWRRDLLAPGDELTMSVNVSGHQLVGADLVADVDLALARSGLDPRALVLEVTETALVSDVDAAACTLGRVRELGVRVAIDDFGTGYSSLGYLRRFPVDILKIDRSFVSGIEEVEVPPMVRGLLDLGRTLDLVTVAEGVELDFQAQLLRDQRCSHAQGFLFAEPLDAADVELLLIRQAAGNLGYGAE